MFKKLMFTALSLLIFAQINATPLLGIPANAVLFVDTDKISDSEVVGSDDESSSEDTVIKKLTAAIKAVGLRYNASLVLAASEATWLAATAIICVNPSYDITQEVKEELKKDCKSI